MVHALHVRRGMWGDFFFPLLAYAVTLLALTIGAAAFHRLRHSRSPPILPDRVLVRLTRRAPTRVESADERRAA